METVKTDNSHPTKNALSMPIISINKENNDSVMMDVEESIHNPRDAPSLPSIKNLPSLATASFSANDFIRHRMSDMSVSQARHASPLEPNSHQPFYESLSRRGSLTDPSGFCSRRPSVVDATPLSRRGSTTTDYSSRSPSPSSRQRYYEDGYTLNRQSALTNKPHYDPFQRRHSIAEPSKNAPKGKAFKFPAAIPELPVPQMSRKASLIAEESYLPARRASMPLVPSENKEMPYSRSPALRVSHKMAERKRRKEMKGLFDDLRDALPVEKDMKTSKWEILSKAIEYISLLKHRDNDLENEINELRREIDSIKRSG